MLLLHTLSRLTFSDQEWRPLLAGFLLHLSAIEGYQPELEHCVECGNPLTEGEALCFGARGGGCIWRHCRDNALAAELQLQSAPRPGTSLRDRQIPLSTPHWKWMIMALQCGSASWVNSPDQYAPYAMLRRYTEMRLDQPPRAAKMLPD